MMSVGAMGGGQGGYYVGLATEDYYLAGGEPPGVWIGQGAERLGLTDNGGLVERESFLRLFDGFDPKGNGRGLVQNAGKADRQPGWDLTFSAPKSVSALWACGDPELRQAVQEAHFAAVQEACRFLEETHGWTRRGKGGKDWEPASLLIATFEHGTSRAQDPQLHTHALVLNMGVREDGTIGSILSQPFYQARIAAGTLYQLVLENKMREMGFSTVRTVEKRGNTFEVEGVPGTLVEEFSTRHQQIEQRMAQRGESGAKAAAVAALDTRQVKQHVAREVLIGDWQKTGQEHHFTEKEVQSLRRAPTPAPEANEIRETIRQVMEASIKRLTMEQSHFSENDLLKTALAESLGTGLWGSLVRTAIRHAIGNVLAVDHEGTIEPRPEERPEDLLYLGTARGEVRYTTRELFELEKGLLASTQTLHGHLAHGVSGEVLAQAISRTEENATQRGTEQIRLSAEQQTALSHLTRETGAIAVLSGMAGTGKTTVLSAAREAWETSGYKVVGAAVAGKAARGLEEGADVDSGTVAKLIRDVKRGRSALDSRTVLIVDEAGMLGTRQMAFLVDAVKEAGAKLILVGDARQLQPIEVGGPFRAIALRIGEATLRDIIRQDLDKSDPNPFWRREVVVNFAEGNAANALSALQERGYLHIADDRKAAMRELMDNWRDKGVRAPSENLIIAGTRQETRALNRMAQDERKAAGMLGFRQATLNGEAIHEKDRVLLTRRDTRLGVENGDLGTVKRIDAKRQEMVIALDRGGEVAIPYKSYDAVQLGYAMTTHKGQGATVKNAYLLCGGSMTDLHLSYVQASRARQETHLFTERLLVWDRQQERRVDRTVECLASRMSHSRQKELAHDIGGYTTDNSRTVHHEIHRRSLSL